MIIRKPYAFLIKYFKIIHILLFLGMLYLIIRTRSVYVFFKNFLATGTYTYTENMAFSYINIYMILITILLVGILLLIYFLMKSKEKKVLYYLMATIFYFISFVVYLFFITIFNNLEYSSYSNQSLVLFRDLSMVIYYLNYVFLVVAFIRGFGFNIKKFNFERDIKDLEISDEDREEIEVSSNIDYENLGNFFRKRKRNFGYYIKENSFILTVFLVITILIIGASFVLSNLVINKKYKIGETVIIGDISYVINNAFIINKDLEGKTIKNNIYYLVVDFNVINNSENTKKIDIKNTRIKIDNNYYYPKNNVGNIFNEFGIVYNTQNLKSNVDNNFILVFEINSYPQNAILELYQGKRVNDGEATLYYKNVSLFLDELSSKDLGKYKINETINLEETYYKKGSFKIINYEVLNIEKFSYQKCLTENNCQNYSKDIVPSSTNKLLKIEYDLSLDKDIFVYLNIDENNNKNIKNVTPSDYYQNTVLFEIPNNVDNNLTLLFDIRNTVFRVSR